MRPSNQPSSENSSNIVWGVLGLFVALVILWKIVRNYALMVFLHVKWVEFYLLSPFFSWAKIGLRYISHINVYAINDQEIFYLNQLTSNIYAYITGIILTTCCVHLYIRSPTLRCTKKHSMNTLLKKEVDCWPFLQPITNIDLATNDIYDPKWGVALSPLEFLIVRDLIIIKDQQPILNYAKTYQELAFQLGMPWDINQLHPYQRILFVILWAKMTKKNDILKNLEQYAFQNPHDDHEAKKWIPYISKELLQSLHNKHAYVGTAMATMLTMVRQYGVFPTSEFLWLKPLDKKLWFMLSSVGRRVSFAESSGCFIHWQEELHVNCKINPPQVWGAIQSLETILRETDMEHINDARNRTRA